MELFDVTMILAYNTNGLAHHSAAAGLELLAELGYRGVGLTLDHGLLNPFAADLARSVAEMRDLLQRYRAAVRH